MAEIQAEGLRAASELLERVLDRDDAVPPAPASAPEREYTELLDAWAVLLQRVAAGLARPADADAPLIPIESDAVAPPLRLELAGDGSACAEIWLHNGTVAPVGPLVLRCGALSAPDGTSLEGARVDFEPDEIEQLPARSSRGVVVSLRAASSPPGVYRGTIQARGAPALWLPIEVSVKSC